MAEPIDPGDLDALLTFRHLAADAKDGLAGVMSGVGDLHMEGGYVESDNVLEAYRPLCIPVRRAYRDSDRASFTRVSRVLGDVAGNLLADRLRPVADRYEAVRRDLDAYTILNDRHLVHREVFEAWMDAVIFGSFGGKDAAYRKLLKECGKAVEGVAVRITEAIAERMLELDQLIADALEPT
jgi:hypothetical protein